MEGERRRDPKIDWVCEVLGGAVVTEVPIPIDCVDGFTEAFYARPEVFLDPAVRSAQSAWSFISDADVDASISRLADDLASEEWDRRFGCVRPKARRFCMSPVTRSPG